jgi:hypothetical protein
MFVGTSRCPVSDAQLEVPCGFFAASFFRLTGFVRGELLQAVTSIRELAENFDKRSGAVGGRWPSHSRRCQPSRKQS